LEPRKRKGEPLVCGMEEGGSRYRDGGGSLALSKKSLRYLNPQRAKGTSDRVMEGERERKVTGQGGGGIEASPIEKRGGGGLLALATNSLTARPGGAK